MGWRWAEAEPSLAWLHSCLRVDPLHLAQGSENAGAEVVVGLALRSPHDRGPRAEVGARGCLPCEFEVASRPAGFAPIVGTELGLQRLPRLGANLSLSGSRSKSEEQVGQP